MKRFKIRYLFVLPLFLILSAMAVGGAGACGYILLICYSGNKTTLFWGVVIGIIVLAFWAIVLQCISVWFPKQKDKKDLERYKDYSAVSQSKQHSHQNQNRARRYR